MRQTKSVFISSTYLDLKSVRKKVSDRILGLFHSVIQMEHFPAIGRSTLENSIKQLEKGCNYYVLIVGHKYGTIPEGKDISITHAEYRLAVQMKRKNEIEDVFIFIGSDEMLVEQGYLESDLLREKRKRFIEEIKTDKNSYRSFATDEELFQAIYETFSQAADPNATLKNSDEIFRDFEQIKYTIEANLESKALRVNKTLTKIVKGFSPVFDLESDSEPSLKHPIISQIKDNLNEAIPHIVFDTNFDGRIDRWGIRHVIFRIETAVKLMTAIKDGTSF